MVASNNGGIKQWWHQTMVALPKGDITQCQDYQCGTNQPLWHELTVASPNGVIKQWLHHPIFITNQWWHNTKLASPNGGNEPFGQQPIVASGNCFCDQLLWHHYIFKKIEIFC
jgi:hypothetical protein